MTKQTSVTSEPSECWKSRPDFIAQNWDMHLLQCIIRI